MRRFALTLVLSSLAFTACDDEPILIEDEEDAPIAGSIHPLDVGVFPHDRYSVRDDSTYTGRRVTFSSEDYNGAPAWIQVKRTVADELQGLDGFGTSAGGWARLSEPLDLSDHALIENATQMGFLEGESVQLLPIEITPTTNQVAIRPLYPLPPNTPSFFYITTELKAEDGQNYQASNELKAILRGETPEGLTEEIAQRTRDTADALVNAGHIEALDELAVLSVFTTQAVHETDLEIAQYIQTWDPEVEIETPCQSLTDYRRCSFTFLVPNFINEQGTIDDFAVDQPGTPYRMRAWVDLPHLVQDMAYEIPWDDERGYAPLIFGHGLTGGGKDSGQIARFTAEFGFATLAIDAPQHADHPLRTAETGELDIIFELFGISVEGSNARLNTRKLRDGWRHSNYDKLTLLEALRRGIDFDGDGKTELDTSRLTYLGGSLGAIQGSQFLALSDDFAVGMYAVGGGRISDIIRYGDIFALVNKLLFPRQGNESIMQILIMVQTALEKGDGINWAPYVLQNRLIGERIPQIAMQISVPDEVVPAESGMVIARALGIDALGEMPLEDPLVSSIGTVAENNHPSGVTAAMIQTDWIRTSPTSAYRATSHARSATSEEGMAFWTGALRSFYGETGVMRLQDPYSLPDAPVRPGY